MRTGSSKLITSYPQGMADPIPPRPTPPKPGGEPSLPRWKVIAWVGGLGAVIAVVIILMILASTQSTQVQTQLITPPASPSPTPSPTPSPIPVPHISYYDSTNKDLKYATKNPATSAWTLTTVDSGGDVGQHSSLDVDDVHLAFDGSVVIHISYYD